MFGVVYVELQDTQSEKLLKFLVKYLDRFGRSVSILFECVCLCHSSTLNLEVLVDDQDCIKC